MVYEIRKQTDKQTDRHADRNISHPYRVEVMKDC